MLKSLLTLLMLCGIAITARAQSGMDSISHLDLNQYMGTWYEIARLPNSFQDRCLQTRAQYALLANGSVAIRNECVDAQNHSNLIRADGIGRIVDPMTHAKLKVSFVPVLKQWGWFGGDYWVLAIDEDYEFALVGSPNLKTLWILSRSPTLEPEVLEILKNIASNDGFDVGRLIMTPMWND